MTHDVTVGGALRFLRESKGLSARKLSIDAGLSPSYVGKLEAGHMEPSFHAFCAISKVLEMNDAEVLFLIKLSQGTHL